MPVLRGLHARIDRPSCPYSGAFMHVLRASMPVLKGLHAREDVNKGYCAHDVNRGHCAHKEVNWGTVPTKM